MYTALLALPLALQLASDQSQFTRPAQPRDTMRFREMDRNGDGVLTRSEWRGSDQSFRVHDWNGDGILSGDEVRSGAVRPGAQLDDDNTIQDDREDTFENLDVNANNQIERSEWHGSQDSFYWLDRNNDGVLSRREVVGRMDVGQRTNENARRRRPAGVATSGRQDCDRSAARIVDDIYQQVLERSADQSSAGTTQALAEGRMTVRDIVVQLAKSDEHAQRFFWEPMARTIYRQILKRDPSQRELQEMTADLASGTNRLPEVIARTARRASNNDEDAVRVLYRHLLGREADEAGLRGFTEQARRDGIESVARAIVASPEYRQRSSREGLPPEDRAAFEASVRSLYRHVLGREPDPIGLQDLTQLAMTYDVDAVIDRMLSSTEYQNAYGTDVVPGRNTRYCGSTP